MGFGRFTRTPKASTARRERAHAHRADPTWTEAELWKQLRRLPVRIRRQAPIGAFIADFACLRAKLIIELDGAVHDLPEVAARDAARDAWLKSEGYSVLRIDARRIPSQTTAVVEEILAAIAARIPLPLEGEGVRGWGEDSASTDMTREAVSPGRSPSAPSRSHPTTTPTQPSPLEGEGS